MVAILLCVALFLMILWISYGYTRKKTDLPPLAEGALPILGHNWLGFVKKERLYKLILDTVLGSSFKKAEEVVHIYILGIWRIFVCMDPDDGYLLLSSCLKKDAVYNLIEPLVGGKDGLVNADVLTWKTHRKLLNPTMNQSVLDSYLAQFNEQSRQLVASLSQELGRGYFDPLAYLAETVLQITCATLMGVNVEDDKWFIKEYGKAAEEYANCFLERMIKFYFYVDTIFNLSNVKKRQDAAVKVLHYLADEVMRNKKAKLSAEVVEETDTSTPRFKSFLDLLLELGKNGALSESEIRQEVNTFIGAANDTTYNAIGMMLLNIGSYPEVQKKIVHELEAVFGGSTRDVEKQDMSKLKYLEAVIKETLRLYPVVIGVARTVDKDIKLKRYTLPAGSRCFMSIYHAGRHRSWGADVEQFRPERWLDGSLPRSAAAFAVFGLGKRSCIGSNFSMMVMKTVLCHVVRRYRISGDVTRLVRIFGLVTTPASGHHISLERRTDD